MTDLRQFGSGTLEDDGCTTCGDAGVPVRVLRVEAAEALCEDRTGRRAIVRTDFTPGVAPGDVLLVHMGVAIAAVPRESASRAGV